MPPKHDIKSLFRKTFLTLAFFFAAGTGRHDQPSAASNPLSAQNAAKTFDIVAPAPLPTYPDCGCVPLAPEGEKNVTATDRFAEIIIDPATGNVLFEKNTDTTLYPASLTKMMTLYLTFEDLRNGNLTLDQKITVSKLAAAQEPSSLKLKEGRTITVKNAILALTVHSANDVAVALSEARDDDFICRMNAKACALGMTGTHFNNPSGLPDPKHFSTVRDMAILSQALIRDFPEYYHYFSVKSFTYNGVTYTNHNKLLGNYAGLDGLKTGYIAASGFNLSASAVHGDTRLIAVVFGGRTGKSRDAEMVSLLNKGFAQIKKEKLAEKKAASVRPG